MVAGIRNKLTGKILGKLANYSISRAATPMNPADSGSAIVSFKTDIVDPGTSPKTSMGKPVAFTDVFGETLLGETVSYTKSSESNRISLDSNTIFERLNAEQTVLPIIPEGPTDQGSASTTLLAWLQESGIFEYTVPGYVQSYIGNTRIGYLRDQVGRWYGQNPTGDVNTIAGVAYSWTGTPSASTSRMTRFATVLRTNLCTNPAFKVNTTGWTNVASAAITQQSVGGGLFAGKITFPTAAGESGASFNVAVLSGKTYTVQAIVHSTNGAPSVRIKTPLGTYSNAITSSGVMKVSWVAPANATVAVTVAATGTTSTQWANIQTVIAEDNTTVVLDSFSNVVYFDGDTQPNFYATDYQLTYGKAANQLNLSPAAPILLGAMFRAPNTPNMAWSSVEWWVQESTLLLPTIISLELYGTVVELRERYGNGGASTLLASLSISALLSAIYSPELFCTVLVEAHPTDATKANFSLQVVSTDGFTSIGTGSAVSVMARQPAFYRTRRSMPLGTFNSQSTSIYTSYGSALPTVLPQRVIATFGLVEVPNTLPGFTGNVWEKIKEYCSIFDLDFSINSQSQIIVQHREISSFNGVDWVYTPREPSRPIKANLADKLGNRTKARSVEVVHNKLTSTGLSTTAELWRADSVYSLNKGETQVQKVQTDSTFIGLLQPIPVSGVPVPYTWSYGSYVVTGNDGYIVDPQWWKDNGGSIKVAPTKVSGEIEITLQAPNVDTVRAPYRISEGVADRPALYITGVGIKVKKETLTILTGASDVAEAVGTTFDSPFVTDLGTVYRAGNKLANFYGEIDASITFTEQYKTFTKNDLPYLNAPKLSTQPEGKFVYTDGSMYRISMADLGPNSMNLTAEAANFLDYVDQAFAGMTLDEIDTYFSGMNLDEIGMTPLKKYIG